MDMGTVLDVVILVASFSLRVHFEEYISTPTYIHNRGTADRKKKKWERHENNNNNNRKKEQQLVD